MQVLVSETCVLMAHSCEIWRFNFQLSSCYSRFSSVIAFGLLWLRLLVVRLIK